MMNVSYISMRAIKHLLFTSIILFQWNAYSNIQFVEGELIVKLKSKISSVPGSKGTLGKLSQKGITLKASFSKMQMHLLKLPQGQSMDQAINEIGADSDVEFVEPNYIFHKIDEPTTRINPLSYEQMLSSISNLSNGNYTQSRLATGVDAAWTEMTSTAPSKPLVAVIDTGIDYNHSILVQSNAIWVNPGEIDNNGIDDDNNGYIDDVYGWNFFSHNKQPWDDEGHGTHVSGIVVGLGMDIYSQSLAESKFQVMALKFLGSDGSGDSASAIQAIDYAINKGARIINASWGGDVYSRSLHEAFTRAYQQGIFIVTAAGNAGSDNDSTPIYPASLSIPGLISVAAANSWDRLASFSNFGVQSVHIAAPGVSIGSIYPRNFFGYSSGTSMAAPFIAGVGALLLRESPQLSGFQLKELILNSATTSEAYSQKIYTSGRVNVVGALRAAKTMVGAQSVIPSYQPVTPARVLASENESSSGSGGGAGGGCGTIQAMRMLSQNKSGGGGGKSNALPVMILMMLPLVLWALLRQNSTHQSKAEVSEFDMRFTKRINVSDKVIVRTRQGDFEADLKNISKGGLAFMFNGKQINVNESVSFVFTNKDCTEQIEVKGRIVWTDTKAIAGVQFHELNQYIQSFLLRSYASSL